MCGIFSYLGNKYNDDELIKLAYKIVHRGPDSTINKRINDNIFFTFHRLAINGLTSESNQPFENDGIHLICNGEIFNYKKLIKENNFENEYKSESDCEIILHLYKKYGIDKTCKLLDGEFAFVLYDSNNNTTYVARDQLGIRSLYWGKGGKGGKGDKDEENELFISSELKSIPSNDIFIEQFPVASYW